MHFNQHCNTPALPALAVIFTPAKAFRVPADTQNSVMLSCFDRDSFCHKQNGLRGGAEMKKTDKTPHQSVVAEQYSNMTKWFAFTYIAI